MNQFPGYVFVVLTDPVTSEPVAVRVDQIVAIVPFRNTPLLKDRDIPAVSLVAMIGEGDDVMVKETPVEVLAAMVTAFRGPEPSE